MSYLLIVQIAKAVDDEVVTRDLVPAFVKLLKDTEAEVRTAIAGQIPGKEFYVIHRSLVTHDRNRLLWFAGQNNPIK